MDTNLSIEQMKRMIAQNEEQIRWLRARISELEVGEASPSQTNVDRAKKLNMTESEYFAHPVTTEKLYAGIPVVIERMEKSLDHVPLNILIKELTGRYKVRREEIIEVVRKLIKEGKITESSNNNLKVLR